MEGCLRGGKPGLRGPQGVALGLRVEFGDHVARPHDLADVDPAGDHPAVDAEREAFLGARTDMPGERHRFSLGAGDGHGGSDRPDFGGRRRRPVTGGEQDQAQPGESGCGVLHGSLMLSTEPPACGRSDGG